MSVEKVQAHLAKFGREKDLLTLPVSTATVELAAAALGVEPARIAKTLCFKSGEGAMVIVAAGDVRIDNAKFKAEFGGKARMLAPEEVPAATGYEVGGVCPFGLPGDVPVYLDISLKRFKTVFPACGSDNTAIELTWEELAEYSGSKRWVDVGKR